MFDGFEQTIESTSLNIIIKMKIVLHSAVDLIISTAYKLILRGTSKSLSDRRYF